VPWAAGRFRCGGEGPADWAGRRAGALLAPGRDATTAPCWTSTRAAGFNADEGLNAVLKDRDEALCD
jgi:hypothetical protein